MRTSAACSSCYQAIPSSSFQCSLHIVFEANMVLSSSVSLIIFILLSDIPRHTAAHPLIEYSDLTNSTSNTTSPSCGFLGNADIYGPGIRIGIYTQTLAVFITKYFALSDAHNLRDSVTVFSIALLSVSFVLAINQSTNYAVEFFIVIQILSWNCLTGVRARSTYSSATFKNRTFRILFTEGLNFAALVMHMWFWFVGVERMKQTPCGTKVFFFARVDIEGWFREVMKCVAILGLLDHGWDWLWRGMAAWGCGIWRERENDMNRAVQGFEAIQKQRAQNGQETPKEMTGKIQSTVAVDSRPSLDDHVAPELAELSISVPDPQEQRTSSSQPRIEEPSTTGVTSFSAASSTWHSESTRVDTEDHSIPISSPDHPIALFKAIYSGELFLDHCIATTSSTQHHFQIKHPTLHKILLILCLIPRPIVNTTVNPVCSPPNSVCIKALLVAIFTLRFPRRAVILVTHIYRSGSLDPFTAPSQLYAALKYTADASSFSSPTKPNFPLPHHQYLALASQIRLLSLPPLPMRVKYMQAGMDFTIHVFVILQIELTLRWNEVRSLGRVDNVGQLVPLLVGVGGFALVLGRWGEQRKGKGGDGVNDGHGHGIAGGDIAGFVDVYEAWKREVEDRK
jgi:hypothetical protein